MTPLSDSTPRRTILKAGAAGVAAGLVAFPNVSFGQLESKRLKLGLIGCGGRGTGAAQDAMKADSNVELYAVGDVFQESIDGSLRNLKADFRDRAEVDPSRQFLGMDAYQKVLESGVDVVILSTPPGFRPVHFEAAVEAGKHIFCEKPMGVDIPGVNRILAASKKAQEKGLAVMPGFCWRRSASRRAAFEQLRNGAIGDVVSYYATYYTAPVKPMQPASARRAEWSDVEWQLRNWMNFSWLSGDTYVEQAVHSVDKVGWAFGDRDPLNCIGVGGRQIPMEGANIFDHFSVIYEFPGNVFATVASRQQVNCDGENADYIKGTKGTLIIGKGARPYITGEKKWRFEGEDNDMYRQEHVELFASIRAGKPVNDSVFMCHSTMLGIMGRMAAYTGKRVSWDQVISSKDDLAPDDLKWDSSFTPTPMPMPGVTPVV
ncbi:MAG: Gfo/Idh/MocA family oxidoreductase [Verrucomicrobiaceae bacterium]|nr:MAG: Gfo/Idh/MocA family oxidoreductase [Verrucomicrobiaceae bacterium]